LWYTAGVDGGQASAVDEFLRALDPRSRVLADVIVQIVEAAADFDVAIKWRQLTFAIGGDFDHWVCAIAATKKQVNLTFHFGSLLTDRANALSGEGVFVRKIPFTSTDDMDAGVIADLLHEAIERLPDFRRLAHARE
jgi:hypothetical protein